MADSQVKSGNICNITSGTGLYANAGGSGTYIADNSISVHMASGNPASGIYATPLSESSVIGDKYTISFIPICATNTTLLIELAGVQKNITFTSGERKSVTIQASANNRNIAFYGGDSVEKTIIIKDIQIEKGETATPYRPHSATGWLHSLRKLGTSTDTLTTLPAVLYPNDTTATVGLKGNMEQSGTPTPSNPVEVNGVGNKTANLLPEIRLANGWKIGYCNGQNGDYIAQNYNGEWLSPEIPLSASAGDKITVSAMSIFNPSMSVYYWNGSTYINVASATDYSGSTFTAPANTTHIRIAIRAGSDKKTEESIISSGFWVMLNTGSTPLPYEPYGYKIPISSADTTTPVYLGEVETTRKIRKYVITGRENTWIATAASPSGRNRFYLPLESALSSDTSTPLSICSHLPLLPTDGTYTTDNGYTIANSNVYIRLTSDYNSLADFKTYLQQQYAAGTPVTVWYVLATETTGIVNEPLRKIGSYADTVSGITIPTIAGANSFDVLTTLKPSEVSLTYTGWHDATVKEWDGSDWQ